MDDLFRQAGARKRDRAAACLGFPSPPQPAPPPEPAPPHGPEPPGTDPLRTDPPSPDPAPPAPAPDPPRQGRVPAGVRQPPPWAGGDFIGALIWRARRYT